MDKPSLESFGEDQFAQRIDDGLPLKRYESSSDYRGNTRQHAHEWRRC
jgi:hypothetical protein